MILFSRTLYGNADTEVFDSGRTGEHQTQADAALFNQRQLVVVPVEVAGLFRIADAHEDVPIIPVSAQNNKGVHQALDALFDIIYRV